MKKIIIIFLGILAVVAAGAGVYFGYFNKKTVVLEKQSFISPLRLSPYVSREQTRAVICVNPDNNLLVEVCKKEYDNVAQNDLEKIDRLFLALDQAKKDDNISDYNKFLIAKAVFAALPSGASSAKTTMDFSAWLADLGAAFGGQANAQQPLSNQANFQNQLLADLASVRAECPATGFENWVITAMCSKYAWIDGKEQPIYSKEYAEAGGPCVFSESAGDDVYHSNSIIDTIMRSENDFVNKKGESTQMACAFSCGSYNCPALTDEYTDPKYCKNPIYRNMGTVMPWDMKDPEYNDYYNRRMPDFFTDAKSDCAERGFIYSTGADGFSSRIKVKDCRLVTGSSGGDVRQDPPDFTPTMYEKVCCECENSAREPYVSINDFSQPGFKGDDVLAGLLDATKKTVKDSVPVIKKDTAPTPPPVVDAPAPPPPPPPVAPKKPEEKPAGLICCYDAKARNGILYYLPFSGVCESGDAQAPFDGNCANPLTE